MIFDYQIINGDPIRVCLQKIGKIIFISAVQSKNWVGLFIHLQLKRTNHEQNKVEE